MTTVKRQIARLPHVYNKEQDSNNYRLLFTPAIEMDKLYNTKEKTKVWRLDIDEARGKVLDHIGGNLQQFRGTDSDVDYRLWLRVKQIANISKGDAWSYNAALDLMLREAYLGFFETWIQMIFLDQVAPSGLTLGSNERWFLRGWRSDVDPAEPAAVVIEFCHQTLFDLLGEYYKDIIDRRLYLNGKDPYQETITYYLWQTAPDGVVLESNEDFFTLDGGTFWHPGDDLDSMMITTRKIKTMMNILKAAGVRLYWNCYIPEYGMFEITEDDIYSRYLMSLYNLPTHIGFGNEGHLPDGTPVVPDGTEIQAYGEFERVPINSITQIADAILVDAELTWELGDDYNVSSMALYSNGDIIAIKNFNPAAKDLVTKMIVRWKLPVSFLIFDGTYYFDGDQWFKGVIHE